MQAFIITITYTDGQVEQQHLIGTLQEAQKTMDIYELFAEVKSVELRYKQEVHMSKQTIKTIKAARGIERRKHFENGGSLVSWRGGTRTITRNKKTYTRKGKSKWKQ